MENSDRPLQNGHGKSAHQNGNGKLEDEHTVPSDGPEGFFVVYVGDEMLQYVIKSATFNRRIFQIFLNKQTDASGRLIMDCDVRLFESLIQFTENRLPSIAEHGTASRYHGVPLPFYSRFSHPDDDGSVS